MRKLIFCVLVAMLVAVGSACLAQYGEGKVWRVGGSWSRLADSDAADVLGDGWSAGVEYSLGAAWGEMETPTDVSLVGTYKSFEGGGASLRDIFAGLRCRVGQGADPDMDGFYVGLGIGAGFVHAVEGPNSRDETNLQWQVFVGANMGGSWYAEAGYYHAGSIAGVDVNNYGMSLGYRF